MQASQEEVDSTSASMDQPRSSHSSMHTYVWTIQNYSFIRNLAEEKLDGNEFSTGQNANLKWKLSLTIGGPSLDRQYDCFYAEIQLLISNKTIVFANTKLALRNELGHDIETYDTKALVREGSSVICPFIICRLGEADPAENFTFGNEITIVVKIIILEEHMETIIGDIISPKFPKCTIIEDFSRLLKSGSFSDVELATEGKIFKAHKSILAARSSYFARVFEDSRCDVLVLDHPEATIADILEFIYTGRLPRYQCITKKLLYASIKFQLKRLQAFCEAGIAKRLNTENTTDYLILANIWNTKHLKKAVMNFILRNAKEVGKTQKWYDLSITYPSLVSAAQSFVGPVYSRLLIPKAPTSTLPE